MYNEIPMTKYVYDVLIYSNTTVYIIHSAIYCLCPWVPELFFGENMQAEKTTDPTGLAFSWQLGDRLSRLAGKREHWKEGGCPLEDTLTLPAQW